MQRIQSDRHASNGKGDRLLRPSKTARVGSQSVQESQSMSWGASLDSEYAQRDRVSTKEQGSGSRQRHMEITPRPVLVPKRNSSLGNKALAMWSQEGNAASRRGKPSLSKASPENSRAGDFIFGMPFADTSQIRTFKGTHGKARPAAAWSTGRSDIIVEDQPVSENGWSSELTPTSDGRMSDRTTSHWTSAKALCRRGEGDTEGLMMGANVDEKKENGRWNWIHWW